MSPPVRLPRRQPGTHLPRQLDRPPPYVGRAQVPGAAARWSTDMSALLRITRSTPGGVTVTGHSYPDVGEIFVLPNLNTGTVSGLLSPE